ncbi:hypothetical protein CURTO8I2_10009 [Curtobacterium sp. 8I-2]|nr:hypothetical protein CURTO8I2_10009 [Curtobacterium sp. 8I-2]
MQRLLRSCLGVAARRGAMLRGEIDDDATPKTTRCVVFAAPCDAARKARASRPVTGPVLQTTPVDVCSRRKNLAEQGFHRLKEAS